MRNWNKGYLEWSQRTRIQRYAEPILIHVYSEVLQKFRLAAQGRAYPCYETAEELELKRRVALSRGLPPIYDRAALSLDADQKASLRDQRGAGDFKDFHARHGDGLTAP